MKRKKRRTAIGIARPIKGLPPGAVAVWEAPDANFAIYYDKDTSKVFVRRLEDVVYEVKS